MAPASRARPPRRRRAEASGWTSTSAPCRAARRGMEPDEIMTSESQERMLAIVEPAGLDAVMAICARWEVRATVIGRVTDGGRLRILDGFDGAVLADVPAASLHDAAPLYDRPMRGAATTPARTRRASIDDPEAHLLAQLSDSVVDLVAVRPSAVPQHRAGSRRRRDRAAAEASGHGRRHRPRARAHHRRQPSVVRRRPSPRHRDGRRRGRVRTSRASVLARSRSSTA